MQKQNGMTLVGMLLSFGLVIFVGVFLLKTIPVYITNYTVQQSLDSLNNIPAAEFTTDMASNVNVLKTKLDNQFNINTISIAPENIKIEAINTNTYKVTVKYTEIRSLFGNISMMYDFEETKEVHVGPK